MVTLLLMMLNDALAILLAFGTALVLRAILCDKTARFPRSSITMVENLQ
jgi:hypothetical protein